MHFDIITIFPSLIEDALSYGVTGKAIQNNLIKVNTFNPRDNSITPTNRIDDKPYGGGPGMVMQVQPLVKTIREAKQLHKGPHVVYLSPQGIPFNQKKASDFSLKPNLILVCGRYEGVDERVLINEVDEVCSVGDYILSGGEMASLIIIETVSRLIDGVLGDSESSKQDSFSDGLLEYPQYTRPEVSEYGDVPKVLLSGNHQEIQRWRLKQSLKRTIRYRPDLIKIKDLSEEEKELINEINDEE
jgi:tRNA (guanine37-N1)-methyltransferase